MKKKIDTRNVITLALGLLILLCTAFLLFNQVLALKASRQEAVKERDALAKAQIRIKQLESMQENAGDIKQQMERYKHLMPQNPLEDSLIIDIKALANRSGVELSQIKFENRVKNQAYTEMPFKIAFEGRYHNLLNLLQEMRNGPRALRIDEIKISKGQKELPIIRVDISASAFHVQGGS